VQFWIISIAISRRVIGYFEGEGGGGFQKPKFQKESMKLNWNFRGVGEFKLKKLLWEGYCHFLKNNTLQDRLRKLRSAHQCKDLRK